MKTVETRVQKIEKVLGEGTAPRSYTHAQLVALASGATEEEVGPPAEAVVPGKPTMAELIAEAAGLLPRGR